MVQEFENEFDDAFFIHLRDKLLLQPFDALPAFDMTMLATSFDRTRFISDQLVGCLDNSNSLPNASNQLV